MSLVAQREHMCGSGGGDDDSASTALFARERTRSSVRKRHGHRYEYGSLKGRARDLPLEPNHSHFLFVDSGAEGAAGEMASGGRCPLTLGLGWTSPDRAKRRRQRGRLNVRTSVKQGPL